VGEPRFWNVPNTLTLSRLVLAGFVFALIAYGYYAVALVIFVIAALTDALDGYLARLLHQETAIGRQLDPLVDKVIVCGGLIYLLTVADSGLAPWMVTAIVVRELIVQALRSLIEGRGEPFGARTAGKLKTVFQCLAIVAILLVLIVRPSAGWVVARNVVIWTAVVLTVYSGMGYVKVAWPKLKSAA
jgi:CDP-diacylglycerol--glycerol-3-phosphate 3-phosphatidyltransferase